MTSMVGDTSLEGLTEEDTKNFSVRSYLKQLTPVLAEALTAMEKEKYALATLRSLCPCQHHLTEIRDPRPLPSGALAPHPQPRRASQVAGRVSRGLQTTEPMSVGRAFPSRLLR